ncbi:MAG: packaged DNA stabilization gp4 family protein [Nitrosomonadaceae bacterium]
MSETAGSIITSALEEINVQASEQDIQGSEFSSGIKYLNRMMAGFASSGLALGYTVVTAPASVITVADGAIEGIIFNLAIRLGPQYNEAITPDLRRNAKIGLDAIRDIAVTCQPTGHPCTQPVGSGNEWPNGLDDKFYPCPEDGVLTEEGGNIALESDT